MAPQTRPAPLWLRVHGGGARLRQTAVGPQSSPRPQGSRAGPLDLGYRHASRLHAQLEDPGQADTALALAPQGTGPPLQPIEGRGRERPTQRGEDRPPGDATTQADHLIVPSCRHRHRGIRPAVGGGEPEHICHERGHIAPDGGRGGGAGGAYPGHVEQARDTCRGADQVVAAGVDSPQARVLADGDSIGERRDQTGSALQDPRQSRRAGGRVSLVLDLLRGRPQQHPAEHGRRSQDPLRELSRHRQHDSVQPGGLVGDGDLSLAGRQAEGAIAGECRHLIGPQPRCVDHHSGANSAAVICPQFQRVSNILDGYDQLAEKHRSP